MNRPDGRSVSIAVRVGGLLDEGIRVFAGGPAEPILRTAAARLRGPLRVALAGRVKAGKSTLLNALVGQELAATDAGECTALLSWYVDGVGYRVDLHPVDGAPRQVPFRVGRRALDIDLRGTTPEQIERLVVTWPSAALRRTTLIDTPGLGSARAEVSARSARVLAPERGPVTEADAVVYLMRHAHADDVAFLESFRDRSVDRRTVSTIGVLSRADEVGHARPDAMASAARVAERYRRDPRVRALCQTVVPVAGLLASSAADLRESEHQGFARLAAWSGTDRLLLSVGRFTATDDECPVDAPARVELLRRFGIFGVRHSVRLIRERVVDGTEGLARELAETSGMTAFDDLLNRQFAARADVLKARSALAVLDDVLRRYPVPTAFPLMRQAERVHAHAHEFAEVALIDDLRHRRVLLPPAERDDAERLLGGEGMAVVRRLGLPEDADAARVRRVATAEHRRWQRRAENPASTRDRTEAARVLVRTCEGILADDPESGRAADGPHG